MSSTLAQLSRAGTLALVACLSTVALQPVLHAAPPANDTCATAIQVSGVPFLSPIINVLDATTNGDPVPLPPYSGLKKSVWFRFVPAATALYTVSVGEDTETYFGDQNSTDTVMALYSATGCGGPFTLVAENDDAGFLRSALTNNLTSGVTYFIVVWVGPVSQETNQALNVQLRVTRPVVPANNICSGAITVTNTFPFVSPNIDTLLATTAANETTSCEASRGVWFTFTPAVTGTYILGLDREPATSLIDPTMTLFVSGGGCNGPFTELSCTAIKTRPIIRSLTGGTAHFILVADIDPEPIPGATTAQLRVSQAGPPTVTTLPASSIASTGTVLNTVINPNGLQTRYFFEFGTTTNYGNMTANRLLSLNSQLVFASPASTNGVAMGFTLGVTNHFRAVGSNSMGKVFGVDQTFFYSTNRPTIAGTLFQANGNFRFHFTGNPSQLYVVEHKTNLTDQWTDSGAAIDRGAGLFDFVSSGNPHTPGTRRFFRVRSP